LADRQGTQRTTNNDGKNDTDDYSVAMDFLTIKQAINIAIVATLFLVCVANRLRGYREYQNRRVLVEAHGGDCERLLLEKKGRSGAD